MRSSNSRQLLCWSDEMCVCVFTLNLDLIKPIVTNGIKILSFKILQTQLDIFGKPRQMNNAPRHKPFLYDVRVVKPTFHRRVENQNTVLWVVEVLLQGERLEHLLFIYFNRKLSCTTVFSKIKI